MMQLKQAEHLPKVSLGSRGLASGDEGCKGKHHLTLENF